MDENDQADSQTAMPVAEKLDPFTAYLPYRLYRESTRYVSGKVVKVRHVFTRYRTMADE
jgi:hypothetical protein